MSSLPHLVTCRQFGVLHEVTPLLDLADDLITHGSMAVLAGVCRDRILATLFYAPSLRTRFSFESAFLRLGGQVISSEAADQFSSHVKGESLEDTIRVVSTSYADAILLRHYSPGAALRAAGASSVPVINAGDGDNEHPTQALLDLYTVRREVGRLDHLKVALVGDLRGSRTVHSLLHLLSLCHEVELVLTSPPQLPLPEPFRRDLIARGVTFSEVPSLRAAIDSGPDVVYLTRLQKNLLAEEVFFEDIDWDAFCLSRETAGRLKDRAAVLHPLPRNGEIPPWFDADPRAAYFRQTAYGTMLRMAILAGLFGREHLLKPSAPVALPPEGVGP